MKRPVRPLAGAALSPERYDPPLAIPADALLAGPLEAREQVFLADNDDRIAATPAERLGPPPSPSRKWRLALAASLIFHAAAALLLIQTTDDGVLIEGAEDSGIAFLGDAAEDQLSAGAEVVDAVNVTMITMLEARPVETVVAEAVTETAERVEAAAADRADIETLQPVEETAAERVTATETVRPETAQSAEAVEPEAAAPVEASRPAARLLATQRAEPVDDTIAAVVEPVDRTAPVEAAHAEKANAAETAQAMSSPRLESVPVQRAETVPIERAEPVPVETAVEAARAEPSNTVIAETITPVEEPEAAAKPAADPKPRPAVGEAKKKPAEDRKTMEVANDKPAKKQEKVGAKSAGNGGANETDARKGRADGQADGTAAARSKGGRNSAAGSAALSNYPGKVAAKLRRSLRYPAEAKRDRLRGEVRVSFVVSAGGGVGSVRVARSSGSAVLDKAALDTVRRAAPFPPIPDGAGRSSWSFTVPLAFSR